MVAPRGHDEAGFYLFYPRRTKDNRRSMAGKNTLARHTSGVDTRKDLTGVGRQTAGGGHRHERASAIHLSSEICREPAAKKICTHRKICRAYASASPDHKRTYKP